MSYTRENMARIFWKGIKWGESHQAVNREEINEYSENQLREIRRANAKTRNFDANKAIDEDIAAGKTSHLMRESGKIAGAILAAWQPNKWLNM